MILFKKWAKHKVKSYIYCVNQFLREKRHKNETKNVNKSSLFCSNLEYFWSFDLENSENSMVTPCF